MQYSLRTAAYHGIFCILKPVFHILPIARGCLPMIQGIQTVVPVSKFTAFGS